MKFFHKSLLLLILTLGLTCLMPAPAEAEYYLYSRKGRIDATLGVGLTVNTPVRFDFHLAGEYFWQNNISLGVALDTWIRSPHTFIVRPFARYHFDVASLPKLVPYVGGGLGAGINTNGGGILDVLLPNFGFKYAITQRLHVGSDLGFHMLTNFSNTRADFHILFATVSYRF